MMAACVLRGLGVHLNEAFEAISRARGLTVPDTAEQRKWCEGFIRSCLGFTTEN